ncbi:hypothetical protein EIP91_001712 [Steccherinum ochraceum]|uniref:F-box domain-containing protein n=1 Tax=Steccherinum ochraceum TaxID=92696 RepID=A0A4R0RQR0_9APHY|nr:hypothetical protein EIP91_001712 [Steccherinum ochraceum]
MPLSFLPAELLTHIISFACTDGGQTGCALNKTSKTFRAICLNSSLDIQYVAIYGTQRINRFLDTIQHRPPSSRRVKSLLLRVDRENGSGPDHEFSTVIFSVVDVLLRPYIRVLHLFAYTSNAGGFELPQSFTLPYLHYFGRRDPPCPHLLDLYLPSFYSLGRVTEYDFATVQSLRIQSIPTNLPHILRRVFPSLVELTIDALISGPANVNLVHYLSGYCSLEPPLSPNLRKVIVHWTQGQAAVPDSYTNGTWRDDMLRDVMWNIGDSERVHVGWDRNGEDDGGPFKIEVEGRALTVYAPLPLAEERMTMEWEANKRLWLDATGRWVL